MRDVNEDALRTLERVRSEAPDAVCVKDEELLVATSRALEAPLKPEGEAKEDAVRPKTLSLLALPPLVALEEAVRLLASVRALALVACSTCEEDVRNETPTCATEEPLTCPVKEEALRSRLVVLRASAERTPALEEAVRSLVIVRALAECTGAT